MRVAQQDLNNLCEVLTRLKLFVTIRRRCGAIVTNCFEWGGSAPGNTQRKGDSYILLSKRIPSILTRAAGLVLAACLALACVTVPAVRADALASDDYTQWKQGDAEWNQSAAWPGSYAGYIANSGCWITSISMLLRQCGFVSEDVDEFNPWICAGQLYSAGALTGGGLMVLSMVGSAYSGFDYAGSYTYSYDKLAELLDEGYACALLVKGGGHMVAVRGILEDGTVMIMDPGWDYTTLDEWGGATEIITFGPFDTAEKSSTDGSESLIWTDELT